MSQREPGGVVPFALQIDPTPANDDFAGRLLLVGSPITNAFVFLGATTEPGEIIIPGAEEDGTLWWDWTAPADGSYLLAGTVMSYTSIYLGVFSGADFDHLHLLGFGMANSYGSRAIVSLRATAGETYHLAFVGPPTLIGQSLNIQVAPGPANDDFANPIPLQGLYAAASGTTVGATRQPGEPALAGRDNGASVWYSWTAPASGPVFASLQPRQIALSLSVFSGPSLDSLVVIGTNGTSGRVAFTASEGTAYWLAVDAPTNSMMDFTVEVGPRPTNDNFADRILLSGMNATAVGVNLNAGSEPGEYAGAATAGSVWWNWLAPSDGLLRIDLSASESKVGPAVDVYLEPLGGMPKTTLTQPYGGSRTNKTSVSLAVSSGSVYDFRVTTSGGDSTNIVLALVLDPAPGLTGSWADADHQWLRGGDALWFVQTNVVHDPPDALQAGPLPTLSRNWVPFQPPYVGGGSAWIQGVFPGPSTLQFWWKTDPNGILSCSAVTAPSGTVPPSTSLDWRLTTVLLSKRTNVVRWTASGFPRPTSLSVIGEAWLDGISVVPLQPDAVQLDDFALSHEGTWNLKLQGEAQRFYHIQTSTDLVQWVEIANVFRLFNGPFTISQPINTNAPALFLRSWAE